LRETQPGLRGSHVTVVVFQRQVCGKNRVYALPVLREYPFRRFSSARREAVDAAMLGELARMSRQPVCREVRRRRAGGEVEKSDSACDQVRVGHLSDPQCAIDSFRDQIEVPLVAGESKLDVRIAREETR